jgi:energy-coupling factor transport system permease protein
MAVTMRRAGELGEAITARGGTGRLVADAGRPGLRDLVAGVLVAAVCTLVFVVG